MFPATERPARVIAKDLVHAVGELEPSILHGYPPVFEGQPGRYLATLARFAELDVATIVPGHGPLADEQALQLHSAYLLELLASVRQAVDNGLSEEEALVAVTLAEDYLPPQESALAAMRPVLQGFHALAVQQTYRQLTR